MAEQIKRIPLPPDFSPEMTSKVAQVGAKHLGEGFSLSYIDEQASLAVFSRRVDVANVASGSAEQSSAVKEVTLPESYRTPSAGEKVAGYFEAQDEFQGFTLSRFEPHAGIARFTRLTPDQVGARNAVAEVLGVKPWEVEIRARRGGGYVLTRLPGKYTPSKHDGKLNEAAETKVPGGRAGWFVRIDGRTLTGEIIPADQPTFPDALPYPLSRLRSDVNRTAFGMKLPEPGEEVGAEAYIDWLDTTSLLVAGLPSSGKRQPLSTPIPVPVSEEFPNGWATMGELRPGSRVYVHGGEVARVAKDTVPVARPTWKFTFLDGQVVLSDVEHLWLVSNHHSRHSGDRTLDGATAKLMARLDEARHLDDSLPAYEVARVLGVPKSEVERVYPNGSSASSLVPVGLVAGALHSEMAARGASTELRLVTTEEIVNSLHLGWATPTCGDIRGEGGTLAQAESQVGGLLDGSCQRLSPALLRATSGVRFHALRELARLCGSRTECDEYALVLPSLQARSSVLELARSLGMLARVSTTSPLCVEVVTSRPLLGEVNPRVKDAQRWNPIVEATYVGITTGKCIKVDHPSHTYLTGGFIVTHNTVTLNALIAGQLASGAKVAIVDTPDKSADFIWMKDFVWEGGWGCESDRAAVTTLALVYEEGQRRAQIIRASGGKWVNWQDMPEDQRFPPLDVIVDEYSALTVLDPVPKLPKDHPVRIEIEETNLAKAMISNFVNKLVKEMRFVGIRIVPSSQVTNQATGMPPSLKMAIGGRMLQGSRPSPTALSQTFNDPRAVPQVPENVAASKGPSRGSGAAELTGQSPFVYKGYYASPEDYRRELLRLGVPQTTRPEPRLSDMDRIIPSLGGDDAYPTPPSRLETEGGFGEHIGKDKPLRGAAAAAHQLAMDAERAANGRDRER